MIKIITKYIPSLKINFVYKIGRTSKNIFEILKDSHSDDLIFTLSDDGSFYVVACFKNLTYNTLDDEMPNYYDLNFDDLNEKQKIKIIEEGALICKYYSRLQSKKNVKILYTKVENICRTENGENVTSFKSKFISI